MHESDYSKLGSEKALSAIVLYIMLFGAVSPRCGDVLPNKSGVLGLSPARLQRLVLSTENHYSSYPPQYQNTPKKQ